MIPSDKRSIYKKAIHDAYEIVKETPLPPDYKREAFTVLLSYFLAVP